MDLELLEKPDRRGYDFRNLPVGTRFQCGDVILEMTQIGKECHSHCEIYKRMGECIMPREGVFAVVIQGGKIKKGDILEKNRRNRSTYRLIKSEEYMKTLYQLLLDRWNQIVIPFWSLLWKEMVQFRARLEPIWRQIRQAEFMEQSAAEIWNISRKKDNYACWKGCSFLSRIFDLGTGGKWRPWNGLWR